MIWGVACYLMWGFFPAFFPLLEPADPMEILAHRFVWTLAFVAVVLLLLGRNHGGGFRWIGQLSLRQWGRIAVAATADFLSVF